MIRYTAWPALVVFATVAALSADALANGEVDAEHQASSDVTVQSGGITYPTFQANQTLSPERLNRGVDPLESPTRVTRTFLGGTGIISGLELDVPDPDPNSPEPIEGDLRFHFEDDEMLMPWTPEEPQENTWTFQSCWVERLDSSGVGVEYWYAPEAISYTSLGNLFLDGESPLAIGFGLNPHHLSLFQ